MSSLGGTCHLRHPIHGGSTLTAEDIKEPSSDFVSSLNSCTNLLKASPMIARKIYDLGNKDLALRLLEKAKEFSASYYTEHEELLKKRFLEDIETAESFINATPETVKLQI